MISLFRRKRYFYTQLSESEAIKQLSDVEYQESNNVSGELVLEHRDKRTFLYYFVPNHVLGVGRILYGPAKIVSLQENGKGILVGVKTRPKPWSYLFPLIITLAVAFSAWTKQPSELIVLPPMILLFDMWFIFSTLKENKILDLFLKERLN